MWCDDFDADLPKVVPGALDALGDVATAKLRTYGRPGEGINCPPAWWTDHGLTAFFATPGYGGLAPAGYVTGHRVETIDCTFAEVVRDEWIHDASVVVNMRLVWKPPVQLMMRLMYDLRGWMPLADAEREATQENVRRSLRAAAQRLRAVTKAAA